MPLSPESPYARRHARWLFALVLALAVGPAVFAPAAHAQSASALDGATALSALQTTRLASAEYFADGMTRRFTASRFELQGPGKRTTAGPPFDLSPGNSDAGAGVWFDGFGQFSRMSTERNADDLQNYFAGGTLGFDLRGANDAPYTLDRLRVGVALGYVYTHFKSDPGVADGHSSSFQGALYASYALPWVYFGAMGRVAYANIETARAISNAGTTQTASGDTSGIDASVYLETGAQLGDPERVAFRPLLGFLYTWVEQDGYSESGAGADDLAIAELTTNSMVTKVGARLTSLWRYDSYLFGGSASGEFGFEPEIHATWNHEFGDRGRHVYTTDSSGNVVALEGAESGRDYFVIGAGYTMRFHPTALLHLTYDVRLQTDRVDQMARAGVMLQW